MIYSADKEYIENLFILKMKELTEKANSEFKELATLKT